MLTILRSQKSLNPSNQIPTPLLLYKPQHSINLVLNRELQQLFSMKTSVVVTLTSQDIEKEEVLMLVSPNNPTSQDTIFLSNIDQTVAFPVETVYFFEVPEDQKPSTTLDITDRVKRSVSEVLLVPYYFMAGRLKYNCKTSRLELVCNNAGVPFCSAKSELRLKDLGDLHVPNQSFQHLIVRAGRYKDYATAPVFTIQVTRFKCGGFSIGFVTNHSLLDGRAAAEMLNNLAAICRGETLETNMLINDRTCIKARTPPQIKYTHKQYLKQSEIASFPSSTFTSSSIISLDEQTHSCRLFSFTPNMLNTLKHKANTNKCSTFEAIVAHLWRARTKAVFDDPNEISSVLFAVDIRSKLCPPLPNEFTGNAVVTASATAKVVELGTRPFSFCVEKIKEAIEGVTDEFVRSVIDWLEVYKGVPSTSLNGNFYVSAWWKLPFHEMDFGYGKPVYGGPILGGMNDFVVLLSGGKSNVGGVNVWIGLEHERMERFTAHVFDI